MIPSVGDAFASLQAWLFETVVQPLLFAAGFGEYVEDAFEGVEWFLAGACELAALYLVLRPLEALVPARPIADRGARLNDFLYTAIHRLGLFGMAVFFTLDPLMDHAAGLLHMQGVRPFNLEATMAGQHPLVAFLMYLVVLDFFDYWFHRGQHRFRWWWALHSLQHANVRIHFGRIGERLLVSPRFHRTHHAVGIGHESAGHESTGRGSAHTLGGCNFGVLLPVWDILFGSANFSANWHDTGIRDQFARTGADGRTVAGRDYGRGFWRQQWLGCVRLAQAFGRGGAV